MEWYAITDDSPIAGTRLDTADIEGKTGITPLGIEHDGEIDSTPDDDVVFEAGDRLLVTGRGTAHEELNRFLQTD